MQGYSRASSKNKGDSLRCLLQNVFAILACFNATESPLISCNELHATGTAQSAVSFDYVFLIKQHERPGDCDDN